MGPTNNNTRHPAAVSELGHQASNSRSEQSTAEGTPGRNISPTPSDIANTNSRDTFVSTSARQATRATESNALPVVNPRIWGWVPATNSNALPVAGNRAWGISGGANIRPSLRTQPGPSSGAFLINPASTINRAIPPMIVPPPPRRPRSPLERRMHDHWHGVIGQTGVVLIHSHAHEFLRLRYLRQTRFHLDEIRTWVDHMAFSQWNTNECRRLGLPEVPHTTRNGLRIGEYQPNYNLWSVHEANLPDEGVTFYRPGAERMTEQELEELQPSRVGIDYVGRKH